MFNLFHKPLCGLILAITSPKSLTVKDKDIYYIQSERRPEVKYRVNFEDGTCTCSNFVHRGEVCKHFYKIVLERAIV
jgi:SWIM zinc finger